MGIGMWAIASIFLDSEQTALTGGWPSSFKKHVYLVCKGTATVVLPEHSCPEFLLHSFDFFAGYGPWQPVALYSYLIDQSLLLALAWAKPPPPPSPKFAPTHESRSIETITCDHAKSLGARWADVRLAHPQPSAQKSS